MASYSEITATLMREAKTRETALPIRNEDCRSQFLLQPQKAATVCLFFHGFTAAPFQLQPITEALFHQGYSVVVPRLPGHGQAGAWWRDNPPPLPTQIQDYQRFALAWLRQAQTLGNRVVIGGLGSGGTLAAWLAYERPQEIDRALLIAPYLNNSDKIVDSFVRHVDAVYYEWLLDPQHPAIGYSGFLFTALQVFLNLGKDILDRANTATAAPLFIISSENDLSIGGGKQRALFEAAVKQRCGYHCFDNVPDFSHTTLTGVDRNRYQELLIPLVKTYLDSDLTWTEVQSIAAATDSDRPTPAPTATQAPTVTQDSTANQDSTAAPQDPAAILNRVASVQSSAQSTSTQV